jgi:hypothetical protein
VTSSVLETPLSEAAVRSMVGRAGAVLSMMSDRTGEAADVLPMASRAVTVIACVAFERAAEGVKLHAPVPLAVVVPSGVAPS